MTTPRLSTTITKGPVGAILWVSPEAYMSSPREASATDRASPSTAISYVDKLDLEIVRNNETRIVEAIHIRGGDSTGGNVLARIPNVVGAFAVAVCDDDKHLQTAFDIVQRHSSTGVVEGLYFPIGKAHFDRACQKPNVTVARGGIELLVPPEKWGELYRFL